jgi:arylsulfatase A-like enzyme
MKPKKLLSVLTAGVCFGFIVGLFFVVGPLKTSLLHIKTNRYIPYRMIRLAAFSVGEPLYHWLGITLLLSLALPILWLLWKSSPAQVMGIPIRPRINWKIRSIFRQKISLITKPLKSITVFLAMLLIIANLWIYIDSRIRAPNHANVILIVCETLRPDHLGYQGYERDTSPHIDSLAQNAYLFKNAYTQAPCTQPSMWNIVTSKYQSEMPAKDEYVTIAEYFKSKNYKTAAFVSQMFLGEAKSNLDQGFDVYDAKGEKDSQGLSVRRATYITDAAIEWFDKNRKHPFFAWLVYFEPHDPYIPPPEFQGVFNKSEKFNRNRRADKIHMKSKPLEEEHRQFLINAYDEEIRYMDFELGRLFAYLKNCGLFDRSIIVLTSDHGEELGDNGHRWDHCQLLSQEEIWIPLLIKMPGQEKNVVREEPVQNIDIYPTLVDYFHRKHLPKYHSTLEGKSLLSLISSQEQADTDHYAMSLWQGQRCLIKGNYKYWIQEQKESMVDITSDREINDENLLNSFRVQLDVLYNRYVLKKEYYQETEKRLKSLGYIKK